MTFLIFVATQLWQHLRQCRQGRKQVVSELSFSCQRDGHKAVLATSVPVSDPAGNLVAFRTALTDITEGVRAAQPEPEAVQPLLDEQ